MEKCKYCNFKFETKKQGYKNGKPIYKQYCSRKCANKAIARHKTEEEKQQIRETILKRIKEKGSWGFHLGHNKGGRKKTVDTPEWNEWLLKQPIEKLKWGYLRKRVILEQNNTCSNCGIKEWMGINITLQIDHKDGDRQNNNRNNLTALCPNCHSITETYCGKNKIKGKFPEDKTFYDIYKTEGTLRKALIECNLTPRGGNYKIAQEKISKFLV